MDVPEVDGTLAGKLEKEERGNGKIQKGKGEKTREGGTEGTGKPGARKRGSRGEK